MEQNPHVHFYIFITKKNVGQFSQLMQKKQISPSCNFFSPLLDCKTMTFSTGRCQALGLASTALLFIFSKPVLVMS